MSVGAFTVVVNVTILSPLLRPIALEFGISESEAGRLGTIAAIIGGFAAIVIAPWMDRVSLRSWVFWQTIFLALITAGSALAPSFAWLLVIRAGSGTTMMLAKCLSSCGEIFPDEARRNRAIGIVVSATTAGVVAGLPVIALVEGAAGWRSAFAVLLIPLAVLLLGSRMLSTTVAPVEHGVSYLERYRAVLKDRRIGLLLIAQVVIGFAYIGWITYLGAYVEVGFGGTARVLSAIFLVAGVGELIANNLVPVTLRRWPAARVYLVCGSGFAAALIASGLERGNLGVVFVTTSFIAAGSAAMYIVNSILLLDTAPGARGAVMSLASAAMNLGGAAGVAIAGLALDWSGSYATSFRTLALVIPVGMIAIVLLGRVTTSSNAVTLNPGNQDLKA